MVILLALVLHAWTPFQWRGVSLDVARHFFPPATIRRFIDLAAHYRLNVVHLHLTDNEAWRLPSRRYPRLPSALHYTEAQLRGLVAYARRSGIDLVPEIDVPAHSRAAIRAYPQLACGSSDTLCPSTAASFAVAEITEAMAIFPSAYIHTGGDEVQGWSSTQRADFERSLDAAIARAHRTMVVWDDESDVAPRRAAVEVWHLGDAAALARKNGHYVIAASDGPLYFDAVQGAAAQEPPGTPYMSTLEQVYSFTAPPGAFGVEAVVWSEHLTSDSDLWYALLPREAAFGAVAWNGPRKAAWAAFRDDTLPRDLEWLTHRGYPFRIPNTLFSIDDPSARYTSVPGNQNAAVVHTTRRRVRVALDSVLPRVRIFYRTASQSRWQRYVKPFSILAAGASIDARSVSSDGRAGAITTLFFSRSMPADPSKHFDDLVSP